MSDTKVQNLNEKNRDVNIDTRSGSIAYNRFEMQVSQAIYMAIKIFDSSDYLLVIDYYDDIALFDNEDSPKSVSYFQMKTSEESININKAISGGWIVKMYKHFENINWIVNELGLITNCPLTFSVNGQKEKIRSDKTAFMEFDQTIIHKIKKDIAEKMRLNIDNIDLTKFFYIITPLSISKHKEIVEQEIGEFLYKKYPKITIDSVKTIHSTMIDILTRRQQYELLNKSESFCRVRNKKGMSKKDFEEVIDDAMIISIPTFDEILKLLKFDGDKNEISLEYVAILSDFQNKTDLFIKLFKKVRNKIREYKKGTDTFSQYGEKISKMIHDDDPIAEELYNRVYISILVIIIFANEDRRKQ